MSNLETIATKYALLYPILDERTCRLWAASEAVALGHGGLTLVASATGITRKRIARGLRELETLAQAPTVEKPRSQRLRRPGGGRKSASERDATLLSDLESLVEPVTRGDPQSPLRWTCKSLQKLAAELRTLGHRVSHETVRQLLKGLDYRLQATRKTREGSAHPDRNAQFEYINEQTQAFQAAFQPVISVATTETELVGDFKNGGREWRPTGEPEPVRVHDFVDQELGKAIPYGVYDVGENVGWVSVGTDHDTAAFAVQSIWQWWEQMGKPSYPHATDLMITADGGGSNGSRCRLWKTQLQWFADATGLRVRVCHFPPGTSKWNKIEHRMFCHITQNWRGRPLVSHEAIVNLIGSTTTSRGLRLRAALDTNAYPTGIKVSDAELAAVRQRPAPFHGEWNYTILPRQRSTDAVIS
jgi:Rhodopirellula transposase DDE domain